MQTVYSCLSLAVFLFATMFVALHSLHSFIPFSITFTQEKIYRKVSKIDPKPCKLCITPIFGA